jgi:hypothetical protein
MNAAKTLLMVLAITAFLPSHAQTANRFDVVITEIMADPTPVVGLPNAEYVEIKNVSAVALPLNGWKLSTKSSIVTLNTPLVLQPDSLLILCANSNVAALSVYGRTLGISSFPALNNDGDLLTLRSAQDKIIHALEYSIDWYGNEAKSDGGWSMEMIDPMNPCAGKDNWKASVNAAGGTPGRMNSVNGTNPDNTPPQLKRAYAVDSLSLQLVFDEPLDSTSAAMISNYQVPGAAVSAAIPLAPLFQSVQLKLTSPLASGTIYELTVNNMMDCKGNAIGNYNKTKTGLPQVPASADVVVNEILFDPKPSSSDYVEFYNRSNKIIDLSTLYVANRNNLGVVSSLKKIAAGPTCLFPGDYLVVTEDKQALKRQYLVKNEDAVLQLSSLPSFPDDKGTVVLQSINGDIIDEVSYSKDWHFALLDNTEGVALERIDPDGPSQEKSNWHSAASTAGYGTPTYRNSQYKTADDPKAAITVSPAIFSPDNDGRDDIATINYQVEERGYVANVFIFDASGRLVRQLVKNDLLGLKGSWIWDGLGEKNNKLPIGTYIVFTEIFNLEGKKKSFKNTIVLARRLN